jgi:hypothetical protein
MKALYLGNGKAILQKDGHTDVASAKKSIITTIQHCEMIMAGLEEMEDETSLPTWWTNKIAVSEHELVQAANYLSADMDHDHGED